jgi:hypothetical protein
MSAQERVAQQQKSDKTYMEEKAAPPKPRFAFREASEIQYIKLLDFTIVWGPTQRGQIDSGEAYFIWTDASTLQVHNRENGETFEFHPSQFISYYAAPKGFVREFPVV